MDQLTIIILMFLLVLTLVIIVLAGVVLSVRSFTLLQALILSLGSKLVAQHQATRQVLTTLSPGTATDTSSAPIEPTPTTPESPA